MRALFVIRSLGHFTYCESAIRYLCGRGHAVEALFDREWSEPASDRAVRAFAATTPNFTAGWSLRRSGFLRKPLFAAREVLAYRSYLTRSGQSAFYQDRWEKFLPSRLRPFFRRSVTRRLLATRPARSLLRGFERLVPPDPGIVRQLRQLAPDVVVATPVNLRFSEEVEYVKAARSLGIPTVVPVLTWDNLTTKGLFHVQPDLTLVWNQAQHAEAVVVHGIPAGRMVVTGSPFFDKWFGPAPRLAGRAEFVRKVGLDPGRPYVVYLGSSKNIARDESWLVRELVEGLRGSSCPELRRAAVLVRPHPANTAIYRDLPAGDTAVWPREGALPDTADLLDDFRLTLEHAVATVGLNTSGMIDAVICDKPCVTVMPPRYQQTQEQAVHFQHLLGAGVLERTTTAPECVAVLERLARGDDRLRGERRRFVRDFVRPRGLTVPAGDLAGRAIEMTAQGLSPSRIEEGFRQLEPLRPAA